MIDQPHAMPGQFSHERNPHHHKLSCISWSAIVVGALVALGLGFLLNLFSLATGLTAFTNKTGVWAVTIGGFLGMLIGVIAYSFFAGWVSGYIARDCCVQNQKVGSLYGFATWCLALVLTVILMSYFGQFIFMTVHSMFDASFAMNAMGHKSATMAEMAAPNVDMGAKMGTILFLMFVLFFVGAAASSIGGYCGIKCKKSKC